MRARVEYKGWKAWGEDGYEIEHLCPVKKTTQPWDFDQDKDTVMCCYCATLMPRDVLQYFRNLAKLLTMVERDASKS